MHIFENKIGDIQSIKMVIIPCINIVYRWICLKIFLVTDNEVQ